jgi:hypothetical protein
MSENPNGIESKVAVLTTEHASLRADHNAFLLEFRTFANEVRGALSRTGKTNWSAVGVILGAVAAVAGIYVAPMQIRLESIDREQALRIENVRLSLELKTSEIETQFHGSDQMRNIQFAEQQRMNAELWEKTFGTRYPSDTTFYPQISK